MDGTLALSGDPDADKLLSEDPFALLIGMVLDPVSYTHLTLPTKA